MYRIIARALALLSLILGLNFNAARADIELPIIKLNQETLLSDLAGPWDDTSSEPVEDDPVVCLSPQISIQNLLSPQFGPLELDFKPRQMGINFKLDLIKSYEILSESHSPKQFVSAFAFNSNTSLITEIRKILAKVG